MTKVFIGGSRHSSHLNSPFRRRLDKIIEKEFPIIVGDAIGADKAVQKYLHSKHYKHVEVFCSAGFCRNNVGNWPTRNVPVETSARGAEFYSAKDRVMAEDATIGLMIWDGKSIGTLLNVYRLLGQRKKAIVYVIPEKRFLEFRNNLDWEAFIASRDNELKHKFEKRANLEAGLRGQLLQSTFFG